MAFNPGAWIKAHKGAAAAAAAGAGLGLYVLWRRSASAGQAAGADGSGPASSAKAPNPAYYANPNQDPSYGAIEAQIAALQKQIQGIDDAKHPKPKPRSHPVGKPKPPRPRRPRPPHRRDRVPPRRRIPHNGPGGGSNPPRKRSH